MDRSPLRASSALAALAVLASAGAAAAADPAPVIAAERAFAARAAEVGVSASFLEFMADDAVLFAPGPVNAKAFYGARPKSKPPKDGGPLLAWWPNWAGMARSSDLGFTNGPAEVNGKRSVNYFTIWKKQPDGRWRWVYDGGASDASGGAAREAPVAVLPPGVVDPRPPWRALGEVKAAEAVLAGQAERDVVAAYKAALSPLARVQGSPGRPGTTPAAVAAELATRAPMIEFTTLGGGASRAGDLAWTYGAARWTRDGAAGSGHYVRVWQRTRGGWRIVFDQLQDDAPPPSSNP
jgi:ketosteroid isomerase-like protein